MIVVPTSSATWAMDTFITELSSVIRNWPDARVSRTAPEAAAASSGRRLAELDMTVPPSWSRWTVSIAAGWVAAPHPVRGGVGPPARCHDRGHGTTSRGEVTTMAGSTSARERPARPRPARVRRGLGRRPSRTSPPVAAAVAELVEAGHVRLVDAVVLVRADGPAKVGGRRDRPTHEELAPLRRGRRRRGRRRAAQPARHRARRRDPGAGRRGAPAAPGRGPLGRDARRPPRRAAGGRLTAGERIGRDRVLAARSTPPLAATRPARVAPTCSRAAR